MPCSFGSLQTPRSGSDAQFNDRLRVTVSVRWLPLVPAPYGTWKARPASTSELDAWPCGAVRMWLIGTAGEDDVCGLVVLGTSSTAG
jgi:hypothetical protein